MGEDCVGSRLIVEGTRSNDEAMIKPSHVKITDNIKYMDSSID